MHRTAVDSRDGWCHNQKIPPKASESFQIVTTGTKIAWFGRAFQSAYHSSRFCTFCKGAKGRIEPTMGGFSTNEVNTRPLISLQLRFAPNSAAGHAWLHCFAFGSR